MHTDYPALFPHNPRGVLALIQITYPRWHIEALSAMAGLGAGKADLRPEPARPWGRPQGRVKLLFWITAMSIFTLWKRFAWQ